MKKYLIITAVLILGSLICSVSGVTLPQVEEEVECSWGKATSVSPGQITINEYDYDAEEEVNVVYALDPNVTLDNVTSLQDIAIGDEVWIDYVIRKGKKIAVGIEVSKQSYDDRDSF